MYRKILIGFGGFWGIFFVNVLFNEFRFYYVIRMDFLSSNMIVVFVVSFIRKYVDAIRVGE